MKPLARLRQLFGDQRSVVPVARALSQPRFVPRSRPSRAVVRFEQAFSPEALAQAFGKVRANGGAAGNGHESLPEFARRLKWNLARLSREVIAGGYRPEPATRIWVPKPNSVEGDERPITLMSVRDRVAQRAAYAALAPFYEARFLNCSFGFRDSLSIADAVAAIGDQRDRGLRHVVDGDIRKCFDTLDHAVLLRLLARDLPDRRYVRLVETWLGGSVLARGIPVKPGGVSQGGVISPLLANVYLHEFDRELQARRRALVRYADDWVILCGSAASAEHALADAQLALERIKLAVHPQKTRITHFDTGFSFVGAFFVRDEQFWISPGTHV
jgi:RNA-directed DNA polymerase